MLKYLNILKDVVGGFINRIEYHNKGETSKEIAPIKQIYGRRKRKIDFNSCNFVRTSGFLHSKILK